MEDAHGTAVLHLDKPTYTGHAQDARCRCRSAYREPSFGEGTLEVYNATHAQWTWHRNQDGAQQVAAQVVLVRNLSACKNRAGASAVMLPTCVAAYSG